MFEFARHLKVFLVMVFDYRQRGSDAKDDHLNKAKGEFFLRMGKDAV